MPVLGVGEGKAFLELWGIDSRSNATFSIERNQPELTFYDDGGRYWAALELTPSGPRLRLFDANNKCRAAVDLDDQGGSGIMVYDENGEEIQRLPE
jgi:hypothetical protein